MTELCDIAFKYGTDKCPQIKHHFTEFYFNMFNDRRSEIKKVVEIGIGKFSETKNVRGASLLMWQEYFPNAHIYGADIDSNLLFLDERIETFLCDQTNPDDLKRLVTLVGEDVDIFIDDGLHTPESQLFTCLTIMPLLRNPTYIIEDVGFPTFLDSLNGYSYHVIRKSRRKYNDDRIVVVRKENHE